MKAVQVTEPKELKIIEKDKPDLCSENDVLVKVKMVGICGSDIHIYHGTNSLATFPRVIGHEIAGVIDKVGKNVKDLKVGDRIVVEPISPCGNCYACKKGRQNVCSQLKVYGVHIDGGLQEYICLSSNLVHKVNNSLEWSQVVLVEPFTIGAQANWRGDVQEGDTVLIMGAGPIGLCCLKIAKSKGATCIITDLSNERLDFAKSWGADYTINVSEYDLKHEILSYTDGEGANVVIDAVCIPSTFEDAIEVVSPAGRVVVLGFDTEPSKISQLLITKKEVTVAGSRLQTNKFKEVIHLFNNQLLDIKDMVTHEFSIEDIYEAISLIESAPKDLRKVVISF